MATAKQIADKAIQQALDNIDQELGSINDKLAKYDALIQARDRLAAARRALLATRSPTAGGGGKGLSQEEVVSALRSMGSATVHELAEKLSANENSVRSHLNRGKDERFKLELEDGVKKWSLREPEEDEEEDED